MREFFYGLIVGAGVVYLYNYADVPKVLQYLNHATAAAVRSTHGYTDGSPRKKN